jgi:hypothetical protein
MLPSGERLLVYHDVVAAEKWWGAAARRRRGRPSLKELDAPLVEEMREMILADPALTATPAAWQLEDDGKLAGVGKPINRVDRAVRRYREKYPT